ncbi:unnamed protein product [Cuscuta campestris]|uniref:CCHC-type domain-containing protein n=1 Tax=Cuscuta campestris TaxID=132261 RepID=A0A484ND64_9ASTE|nr:unnamed protein product [Cuscuta campestris]
MEALNNQPHVSGDSEASNIGNFFGGNPGNNNNNLNANNENIVGNNVINQVAGFLHQLATQVRPEGWNLDRLKKNGAWVYKGGESGPPEVAEHWIEQTKRVFEDNLIQEGEWTRLAISLLQNEAYDWWKVEKTKEGLPEPLTWVAFEKAFSDHYIPPYYRDTKRKEFQNLKRKGMSVEAYKTKFVKLSNYAKDLITDEEKRCEFFIDGLDEEFQKSLNGTVHRNFNELIKATMRIDSIGKKTFDQGEASSKKNNSNTKNVGWGKYGPKQQQYFNNKKKTETLVERLECPTCNRRHNGECWFLTGACMRCGQKGHISKNCPKRTDKAKAPIQNNNNNRPPPRQAPPVQGNNGNNNNRVPARTYAMQGREDQQNRNVIIGMFTIFDNDLCALVDPGSTHSYICVNQPFTKMLNKS